MSGGVDSSLSAFLLKKEGFDVVGVFIKTWHPDFIECNEESERLDAMRVAAHLDIPFLTFDFEKEYKKGVADYMIEEYRNGRTPNPDVMCNREVKFGAFFKKAIEMGADYVATGHYAINKNFNLLKGKDDSKDQSYFLWTLNKSQLEKIIFPVGNLNKKEVRTLSKKYKIPVADKKDSQGVCFLGDIDLKDFLKHYIKEKKGIVANEKGEEIGTQEGAVFYTLGERHGFKINKKTANDSRYYVIGKDIEKNKLIVSNNRNLDSKNLELLSFDLINVNWISNLPSQNKKYEAQIRYHGESLSCSLKDIKKNKVKIIFNKPILVAKGQSIVFYDKEICLGGGIVA